MADHVTESLLPGALFSSRYRVVRSLKTGGMGQVYEVVDTKTERPRALKIMLPSIVADANMRERFALEAKVTARIESDHIVEVIDAGIDPETGCPFIAMELLRGQDLGAILESEGARCPEDVVTLLWQTSLGLEKTHSAEIVHRDLKPENLFLTVRDDGGYRIKILDFGIAKVIAQTTRANTTHRVGTPYYMSPEQLRGDGDIDARADLYALGQIAFTLLTGHPYFEPEAHSAGGLMAVLARIGSGSAETASQRAAAYGVRLPPALDAWFSRATALDVAARFDTASELVDELACALGVSLRTARGSIPSGLALGATLHVPPELLGVSSARERDSIHAVSRTRSPAQSPVLWRAALAGGALAALAVGFIWLRPRAVTVDPPSARASSPGLTTLTPATQLAVAQPTADATSPPVASRAAPASSTSERPQATPAQAAQPVRPKPVKRATPVVSRDPAETR